MKLTEALLRDHETFYQQFEALEQTRRASDTFGDLGAQLRQLGAPLETHAHLEDELLFAALEPYLGELGPLAVMRMEHAEIENSLAQLQTAPEGQAQAELVNHLIATARAHFAKEEQILFPTADQVLTDDVLQNLGAQFEQRRFSVVI
jgi:regulator of cell morphogenesis and NO signaling